MKRQENPASKNYLSNLNFFDMIWFGLSVYSDLFVYKANAPTRPMSPPTTPAPMREAPPVGTRDEIGKPVELPVETGAVVAVLLEIVRTGATLVKVFGPSQCHCKNIRQ